MIIILLLTMLLAGYGCWEYFRHQKNIRAIPVRVMVNGTRGKSSVTRLIAGGLRGGGVKTLAKTTGTRPRLIYPDGSEVPIIRPGKANIIEQLMVFRKAASLGVDALVVECMAVLPPNQLLMEKQMVKSTVGVLTNVRADHLDEMGPTIEDVARSLANTIPWNSIAFTCEQAFLTVLQETGRDRRSNLVPVTAETVTDEMIRGFSYIEHKENVALALAVCEHLGVPSANALRGMQNALPDPGVLRLFGIHHYEKEITFVNAFAANDPDSYVVIWNLMKTRRAASSTVLGLVNCREDRIQRTESLATLIARTLPADHFILVGEFTTTLFNKAVSMGLRPSKMSNMGDANPVEVFERAAYLSGPHSLIIGIGNIVGFGEDILETFTSRGKEIAF